MPEDFATTLQGLLNKSTPGPWAVEDPLGPEILSIVSEGESPEVYDWRHIAQIGIDTPEDAYRDKDPNAIFKVEAEANAALIVHLVNAAPAILEALEALKVIQENTEASASSYEDRVKMIHSVVTPVLSKLNEATS
jgi:hypothetical protein